MRQKITPYANDPRDALELIARVLVGGSYRVPTEGRSTRPTLQSADIAAAVGMMDDGLAASTAVAVATRSASPAAVAQITWQAYWRVARLVRRQRPRPLELRLPADRWRLRLVTYDAAIELIWPERRRPYADLAKSAKMRKSTYMQVHRCASSELHAALNDGRREFRKRLFAYSCNS